MTQDMGSSGSGGAAGMARGGAGARSSGLGGLGGAAEGAGAVVKELVLTRIYDAPRSLVFKMWTDPKHLAQWWGPHGYTNPVCEVDLRPGGKLLIHMQDPVLPVNPMTGVFHEILDPERLVFTGFALPDKHGVPQLEVLTTVTFEDVNGKTKLTMRAQVLKAAPEMGPALEGMEQGWTESLERLGDVLVNPFDTTPLGAREIVIRRFIDAPRERVFDAWTDAAHISNWWGPKGFRTTTYAMDVRPGGIWDFTMHGPGGRDYRNKIEYVEVNRPKFLAYKHSGEAADAAVQFRSTVTFGEMFGKTSLTLRMVFATVEAREHNVKTYHSIEGGKETLERLANMLEKRA
jgi:uncharacterized protein YndB with AHSA1/START domain